MKYLFHLTDARDGRLFEGDAEIPNGWYTTPAAFGVITCPSVDQMGTTARPDGEDDKAVVLAHALESLSKDELLDLAEQRGVTVDKRWGVERLRAALNGNGS